MTTCVFCRILSGDLPGRVVYRDAEFAAIEDINPQAPHHLLVVPNAHHPTLAAYSEAEDAQAVGRLFALASRLGRERGPQGYRVVVNDGPLAGQTVDHVHVHVLAGRAMRWPPG
jgi:histidine triad (HIT) family protein